ncbi:MAG: SNF2-related protein [bacterium]
MVFITNSQGKTLGDRLRELIKKSTELKFLTGFFYFSGLREIFLPLKELDQEEKLNKEFIKILVGCDVDQGINGIYEYLKINNSSKDASESSKKDFFESLRKAFNSEDLDKKEVYEQVEFFIKLLKEGKLVLRKTKKPNHSKLYIFKLEETGAPHLFITGSSNLTRAGLESQDEFNVEIKDYGFEEAENYFNERWKKSIEFSSEDIQKIIYILKEESFLKNITPFQAYAYLLKLYIDLHSEINIDKKMFVENFLKTAGYEPYDYQVEAVLQALKICEHHKGVLIADVVGLGKTIIACALAKLLGKRGIVICPPHLAGDENKTFGWKKYLQDFELYDWEVRSLGKLEETLKFVKNQKGIEVIVVDEAHRFRNENTKRYHYLREICRGKIVILLTATPFNNRPSDIFSLLKLFTIPQKSTIILDENLKNRFEEYERLFEKLSRIKNYHNSKDEKKKNKAIKNYEEIFGNSFINISNVQKKARELAKKKRGIL